MMATEEESHDGDLAELDEPVKEPQSFSIEGTIYKLNDVTMSKPPHL